MTDLGPRPNRLRLEPVEFHDLRALTNRITDGSHNPPSASAADGQYPMISAKNVNNGRVDLVDARMLDEAAYRVENRRTDIQPGDVLLTIVGAIGRVAVIDEQRPLVFQRSVCVIKPDRDLVDSRFLRYVLESSPVQKAMVMQTNGAAQKGLYLAQVAGLRIPTPPMEVQREIVGILDTFAELEAELEAELDARRRQYEHYRTRLLVDVQKGADYLTLGQVGRIVTGRTPKSSDTTAWGSDTDFVTPTDIKNGMRLISAPARRLSRSGAASLSNASIPVGSVLVTCIGADMGKTVLNANDCVTNQQINSIIPRAGIDVGYLFHALTSMRAELRTLGERGGGTMPILNKGEFSRIELPVPSLPVQQTVASTLDAFDALVNDISVGLPAELAARRKQYEYYRDKLLTFEELKA